MTEKLETRALSMDADRKELDKSVEGMQQKRDVLVRHEKELQTKWAHLAEVERGEERQREELEKQRADLMRAKAEVQRQTDELHAERKGITATTQRDQQREKELGRRTEEFEKKQAEIAATTLQWE